MDQDDHGTVENAGFRNVALVLAVLASLALLSFVLAGLGIWERPIKTVANIAVPGSAPTVPASTYGPTLR